MVKEFFNKYFKRSSKQPLEKTKYEKLQDTIRDIEKKFKEYHEESIVKPKKFRYIIKIHFRDSYIKELWVESSEDYNNWFSVYKNFLTWYHCRKSSEEYSFIYKDGRFSFYRKDIKFVEFIKKDITDEVQD